MKTEDLNSDFAKAIREFNAAFGMWFSPCLEIGLETLKSMSELAALRGRDDIAKKFQAFAEQEVA